MRAIFQARGLRVRITAIGDQAALSGMMRLVATAQASGSRTQALADRAAAILFYVAVSDPTFPPKLGTSPPVQQHVRV
jgi:cation transport ATPase